MPHRGGSWQSSPPLLSPPLLIILLPILAFTLLFLTVPPLLSAATNLLQLSSSVKTSWNSLNILLVVLAILFGVFARRNDDETLSPPPQTPNNDVVPDQNDTFRRVSPSSETNGYESQQWYGFSSEETNRLQSPVVTGVTRMKRSSSSYPDLRQMETGDNGYKFRFFDDFEIEKQFRSPARATFSIPDRRKRLPEEQVHVKEIPVDTFEIRPSPVKSTTPPPPPPPPLVSSRRHSNQMHRRVESNSEITELEDPEFTRIHTPPEDPTPPSPPRPSVKTRSERRKSNVKREIAMVWASVLSNQKKRKKKQKPKNDHNHHYDNVEELTNNTTAPPPPPPPPPPSVFQSIFRKGLGKNKKIHSVPAPPPPPPSRRSSKPKNQIPPPPPSPPTAVPHRRNHMKPPLPNKSNNYISETVDTLNAGNQSPLIPIPPPLPPFKMPAMKFAVRGDFVKIRSNQSSRSASPEREHIDVEVTETITVMNHNAFCPSPDVNVKAATFIARLRGEWRLQKLNSIKEKGNASLPIARD